MHDVLSHEEHKSAKIRILYFFRRSVTYLLKLVDKIYKHEMDPDNVVADTEKRRFCPQMDRQTDMRTSSEE